MRDLNDFEVKKTYMSFLVTLIKVDNVIAEDEQRFLFDIARKIDFSQEALGSLLRHPENIRIMYPSEMKERLEIFYHMLYMIKIDKVVTEEEAHVCRKLGYYLLGAPVLVNDLVEVAIKYASEKIPEGEFLKAMLKMMN